MHVNTLHSILRQAGLKKQQTASTRVRGYHTVIQDGYTLTHRRRHNPDWTPRNRWSPKMLDTNIWILYIPDRKAAKAALDAAGIAYDVDGLNIIIDLNQENE